MATDGFIILDDEVVNPLGCKENGIIQNNDGGSFGGYTPLEVLGDGDPR